jgi:dephospho-CoA kinase
MRVVGLTGGIGSGKTTVAKMFEEFGIPVYIADTEAKLLMNRSKVIKRKLKQLLGDDAYVDEQLNRTFVASKIFNNKALLEDVNAIVHPRVAKHFKRWLAKQSAPYIIKEVAVLFENGSYKECDYIITVSAPVEVRIQRVLKRDNSTRTKVNAIIKNQWSDDQRFKHSDFMINNENLDHTKEQVKKIHAKILKSIT